VLIDVSRESTDFFIPLCMKHNLDRHGKFSNFASWYPLKVVIGFLKAVR